VHGRHRVIETVLPEQVVAVETREDWPGVELFAEEKAAIAGAVESRRRQFATARGCARRALEQLRMPACSIPVGDRGEPRWPPGVVGSITHCGGYRACALAEDEHVVSLGIDAEPHGRIEDGLIGDIARLEELRHLAILSQAEPAVHWDRLLFCAKEAVYKTWFPLAHRWLGFEDVTLTIDPARRTFSARLLVPGPQVEGRQMTEMGGRWLVSDGLVMAAITLQRRGATRPRSESTTTK
jgi:4'-phosphopantetheinyl transferase EntD